MPKLENSHVLAEQVHVACRLMNDASGKAHPHYVSDEVALAIASHLISWIGIEQVVLRLHAAYISISSGHIEHALKLIDELRESFDPRETIDG